MDGATERARHQKAMVWWGAMMPLMKNPPTFETFVEPVRRREKQSKEVLQAMFDTLAAVWGAKKET